MIDMNALHARTQQPLSTHEELRNDIARLNMWAIRAEKTARPDGVGLEYAKRCRAEAAEIAQKIERKEYRR